MTQAILKPNEFILRVDHVKDDVRIYLRNPHTETRMDGTYDVFAMKIIKMLLQRILTRNQPYNDRHT